MWGFRGHDGRTMITLLSPISNQGNLPLAHLSCLCGVLVPVTYDSPLLRLLTLVPGLSYGPVTSHDSVPVPIHIISLLDSSSLVV
jgi:hypothetical protein